jgi:hypothetical protein
MDIPGFTAKASLMNNNGQDYNLFSDKSFISLTSSALQQLQITQEECDKAPTRWGPFERGPCIGGRSRRSAVLYDIPDGCSWERACGRRGATIDGHTFDRPDHCVNNIFNIHGIFYTPCSGGGGGPPPPPPPPPGGCGPTSCPLGNYLVTPSIGCRYCTPCDEDSHCGLACIDCHGRGCFWDFGGYHCGA